MEHMLDYQFIQKDEHSFELDIEVSNEEYKDTIQKKMTTSITSMLKEKRLDYVEFAISFVDEILPDNRTGKKRLIILEKKGVTI